MNSQKKTVAKRKQQNLVRVARNKTPVNTSTIQTKTTNIRNKSNNSSNKRLTNKIDHHDSSKAAQWRDLKRCFTKSSKSVKNRFKAGKEVIEKKQMQRISYMNEQLVQEIDKFEIFGGNQEKDGQD